MRPVAARLARNLAWLVGGEVVLKGALFAAGVLVARGLGPAAMGAFTVSYGAAIVLMLFLAGGQVEVVIRETAKDPTSARELERRAREWQARLALVALPLAIGAALLVREPTLRWTLLGFAPYAWLRCWLITVGAPFKGLDRMDVEVGGRCTELIVALLLLAPLALTRAPVWTTGFAFSVGAAAGVAVIVVRFRRLSALGTSPLTRGRLAHEGLSFLGIAIASQVLMRVDTFLLVSLGVAQDAIGRYGVASAPVWGLLGLAQLLSLAVYPTLARSAGRGELRLPRVFSLAAGGLSLGVALALGLQLVRVPLVSLVFGPAYMPAVPVLARLSWALPGACTSMLLGAALASCGRQAWGFALRLVELAVAVAGSLLAIPRWGVIGAATVVVAIHTLSMLGMSTLTALAVVRPPRRERVVFPGSEWE